MKKDQYQYQIRASEDAIRFIRAKAPGIEQLFNKKNFNEWSKPTSRDIEDEIAEIVFARPEYPVEILFMNTKRDEKGAIEIRDGRKTWKDFPTE